jgi:hypothetical protein
VPDQHSPLDRPTPTRGKKRNWVISNKNKDTWQRGWGTLSAENGGRGTPPRTINKQAGPGRRGSGGSGGERPATRIGKALWVAEGGKLHRRGGRTHFPHEL